MYLNLVWFQVMEPFIFLSCIYTTLIVFKWFHAYDFILCPKAHGTSIHVYQYSIFLDVRTER